MVSSKYFVDIPTSGGGNARGEDHGPERIYRAPPPLHRSSTRSAADDQEMYIYISDMNGMLFTLNVLPSDTIDMVKQKFQDCQKIPKDKQNLSYRSRMLEDKYTLENYNIEISSTLYLHDREIKIFIKRTSGDVITLDVLPSDTIEVVKQKIQDREKIPKDKQNLYYVHRKLRDQCTLKTYNINNMSTLRLSETQS